MLRLSRPWNSDGISEGLAFGLGDCLISESTSLKGLGAHSVLMSNGSGTNTSYLLQHPYPKKGSEAAPDRTDFFVRPRAGKEKDAPKEALDAFQRMNEVVARVQELEEALDDPSTLWSSLQASWDRAEHEDEPRMAEIVRQARDLEQPLKELKKRIRRVLRRQTELTPLDRVQEMDRSSMVWLSRQPGTTIAERAGSGQRIMAVVRKENFDTLENRVVHAYTKLATDVGKEWSREHPKAKGSERYRLVESFVKLCTSLSRHFRELGIGTATTDITPNYVLMEDRAYHQILVAWEKLLKREDAKDELWKWQAETWTDFSVLLVVLSIFEMPDAELIAQSPIVFQSEAIKGVWYQQDRPIAVFWLRSINRIVEIMARPERPGTLMYSSRAHVALRISDPTDHSSYPHRVAVWTPHSLRRLDVNLSCEGAFSRLAELQRLPGQTERIRHGLILTPAHGVPQHHEVARSGLLVSAIALDGAGEALANGRCAIRAFLTRDIWGQNA